MASGERRAQAFATVDRAFQFALSALRSLHQGCWLGALDNYHMDALSRIQYARWTQYQEVEYNSSGLRDWERAVLQTGFPSRGALLVAAAGGGREVLALSKLGYKVDAFDCSKILVEHCNNNLQQWGVSARVFEAPPSMVPAGLGQYDGLIVGWGGYMHIAGQSRRISFLRALRQNVANDAPLLLSFFSRSGSSRQLEMTARIAKLLRLMRGSHDEVQLGDTLNGTYDHLFTKDEIASELAAGGFHLVEYRDSPCGHVLARAAPLR